MPQVPRWHHAFGARAVFSALRLSAEWRYIGRQYDDDRNAFVLDRSGVNGDERVFVNYSCAHQRCDTRPE